MRRLLYAAAALCLTCTAAYADPVTYTLTGTFSGTLGTSSFTNAAGTFTYLSDTANTTEVLPGLYYVNNNGGVGTLTIDGLNATISAPGFEVTSAFGGGVGFLDVDSGFSVGVEDPLASLSDLSAPYSDSGALTEGNFLGESIESTSLGDLNLTGGDFTYGSTTFTATLSSTPEPSSLVLLGTGAAGLLGMARRRFAPSR